MSGIPEFAHGYAMKPGGWAPGYCWCDKPGYDGFGGQAGCDDLASLLGRRPQSHEEARNLMHAVFGRWDDLGDPWWDELRAHPLIRLHHDGAAPHPFG